MYEKKYQTRLGILTTAREEVIWIRVLDRAFETMNRINPGDVSRSCECCIWCSEIFSLHNPVSQYPIAIFRGLTDLLEIREQAIPRPTLVPQRGPPFIIFNITSQEDHCIDRASAPYHTRTCCEVDAIIQLCLRHRDHRPEIRGGVVSSWHEDGVLSVIQWAGFDHQDGH